MESGRPLRPSADRTGRSQAGMRWPLRPADDPGTVEGRRPCGDRPADPARVSATTRGRDAADEEHAPTNEHAPGIWIGLDASGTIRELAPDAAARLGHLPAELIGRPIGEVFPRPARAPKAAPGPLADRPLASLAPGLATRIVTTLLASRGFAVALSHPDHRLLLATPQLARLTGYPAEQLQGAPDWLALLVPDAEQRLAFLGEVEPELTATAAASAELRLQGRDGIQRPVQVHVLRLGDTPPAEAPLLLLFFDRTAERPARPLASVLLDLFPLPMVLLDAQGRSIWSNQAHQQLFAPGPGDAGRPGRDFASAVAAWQGLGIPEWLQAAGTLPPGRSAQRECVPWPQPDADGRCLTLRVAPLRLAETPAKLLLVCEESTLQQAFGERLGRLASLETAGLLASGISHDLNNTLGAILGLAELLGQQLPTGSAGHEDAAGIGELARQAAQLVRQTMRLSATRSPVDWIQVNDLILRTANLLRRTLPPTITLELDLQPGLPAVLGAEGDLQQCLLNLCLNARDAMPAGGQLLLRSALVEEPRDADAVGPVTPELLLAVEDEGTGFSEEIAPRLFEPFFTTKRHGTGLGLAMVQHTVRTHGGRLEARRRPERGSSLRILLPVPAAKPEQPPTEPERPLEGGNEILLLVEPAPGLRTATRRILERSGYTVLEAVGEVDGLELAQRSPQPVQLAVVALDLPNGGAARLLAALRRHHPRLVVLLSTGQEPDPAEQDLRAQGAAGFLSKPWDRRTLVAALRQALRDASYLG